MAPDTLRLFVRPKRLQYSTFVSIVDTLVGFAGAPESFYDQARGGGGSNRGSVYARCREHLHPPSIASRPLLPAYLDW